MSDYKEQVNSLREHADLIETSIELYGPSATRLLVYDLRNAAAAIEALQAKLGDRINQDEQDKIREYLRNAPVGPIGPIEPMRIELLTKHGEWVEDTTTYAGPGLSNYKCSLCGKICGTWRRGLEPSELPNWCGNCGADMRAKMEVSE